MAQNAAHSRAVAAKPSRTSLGPVAAKGRRMKRKIFLLRALPFAVSGKRETNNAVAQATPPMEKAIAATAEDTREAAAREGAGIIGIGTSVEIVCTATTARMAAPAKLTTRLLSRK